MKKAIIILLVLSAFVVSSAFAAQTGPDAAVDAISRVMDSVNFEGLTYSVGYSDRTNTVIIMLSSPMFTSGANEAREKEETAEWTYAKSFATTIHDTFRDVVTTFSDASTSLDVYIMESMDGDVFYAVGSEGQEQCKVLLDDITDDTEPIRTDEPHQTAAPKESATTGERNALASAIGYLDIMPFSRSGLIEQLEYEGYTTSEATYAVDNCGADWKEQAALSAKAYLDIMSFSRSGLIDQLMYEGYTRSEAEYGVSQNGY